VRPETPAGGPRTLLGGNIGHSLLDTVDDLTPADTVVLELSSFQLEWTPAVPFRPAVAVLTNIRPHHLDRHDDFEAYLQAKLNMFRGQRAGDIAVIGTADRETHARLSEITAPRHVELLVATDVVPYPLGVPGEHNRANAGIAAAVARRWGVEESDIQAALRSFPGLPHRLELVAQAGGVCYYDDSKSTSAESVATALAAVPQPTVLLCGGKDTGPELVRVLDGPWQRVRAVICFGEASERLGALLGRTTGASAGFAVYQASRLAGAVELAQRIARRGDAVLLSPGCPSYDEFVNYEQRGDTFSALVRGVS
jgi:UDP-N-acetylmuramoylalanine--D-glutamate ligase